MQQANVGDVWKQLQVILTKPPGTITIGGPTVLTGRNAATGTTTSTVQTATPPSTSPGPPTFNYKVKIINPAKRSDTSVRFINDYSLKFESVNALRVKLIDVFKESVPAIIDFNVGYFEGSQQAKIWLVQPDDLKTMYQKYPSGGTISLWCDGRVRDGESENVRKRKRDAETSRKQHIDENERNVDEVYQKLLDKHGLTFDTPRLLLPRREGIFDGGINRSCRCFCLCCIRR